MLTALVLVADHVAYRHGRDLPFIAVVPLAIVFDVAIVAILCGH